MANVVLTSFICDGAVAAQVIAVEDPNRKYIGFQGLDDACLVTVGNGGATMEINNLIFRDFPVNATCQFSHTGNSLELLVMQDADSKVCLSSDKLMLTTDGYPMTYLRGKGAKPWQPAPVFA